MNCVTCSAADSCKFHMHHLTNFLGKLLWKCKGSLVLFWSGALLLAPSAPCGWEAACFALTLFADVSRGSGSLYGSTSTDSTVETRYEGTIQYCNLWLQYRPTLTCVKHGKVSWINGVLIHIIHTFESYKKRWNFLLSRLQKFGLIILSVNKNNMIIHCMTRIPVWSNIAISKIAK